MKDPNKNRINLRVTPQMKKKYERIKGELEYNPSQELKVAVNRCLNEILLRLDPETDPLNEQ